MQCGLGQKMSTVVTFSSCKKLLSGCRRCGGAGSKIGALECFIGRNVRTGRKTNWMLFGDDDSDDDGNGIPVWGRWMK